MQHIPEISIIVPVYKVENYLDSCLNSILNQSFKDFELLLVDDGSPDNSGLICDQYAQKDTRVHVFHKKNGGVSSARLCGLASAKGNWILFVDADDVLPLTALQSLHEHSEGFSMVVGNIITNKRSRLAFSIPITKNNTAKQLAIDLLEGKIHSSPFAKLIKRKYFSTELLSLPSDIVYAEDLIANLRLASKLKEKDVLYLSKDVYVYTIDNTSSISNRFVYTMDYGMRICHYVLDAVSQLQITADDKAMQTFYLNVLKHIFVSKQLSFNHPFMKVYLSKIVFKDCISFKNCIWLAFFKISRFFCTYFT